MGSMANKTVRVVTTMEERERVGLITVVPGKAPPMGKEVDHVRKRGSEFKPEA